VILSLAKIFETNGSAILEPHANIFSFTDMFKDIDKVDNYSVSTSLSQIESAFREHTQTLINKPFGDSGTGDKKARLTKDDKKRELFNFLISQVSEQVASALDNYGYEEVASEVRSDPMFMVNHEAITKNKLVVVIENKVDSSEGNGQLNNYREKIQKDSRFEDWNKLFVYLTIDGEEPSDSEWWVSLSYSKVRSMVNDAMKQSSEHMSDDAKLFVKHYVDLIGRVIVSEIDSDLKDACMVHILIALV
jgi:hypothetical protein